VSHFSQAEFQPAKGSSQQHSLRRARIVGPSVVIAAVALVLAAMIAQSLSSEQRLGMFELSHPYP